MLYKHNFILNSSYFYTSYQYGILDDSYVEVNLHFLEMDY